MRLIKYGQELWLCHDRICWRIKRFSFQSSYITLCDSPPVHVSGLAEEPVGEQTAAKRFF
jgi:hypothetical protein